MTPNKFLEENLPDYQEKRSAYFQDFDIASEDFMSDFEETFFNEALENFVDKMLRITQQKNHIKMEINMNIPQSDIIRFLQKRGYEISAFTQVFPATEEMLLSEPRLEIHTFTATKTGETQNEENLYLKVFEKEIKEILKDFEK
jgi:hypothetical protein